MIRLTKYLFIIGVPIAIISILLLSGIYKLVVSNEIKKQAEKSNTVLTHAISNVVWPQIKGLVAAMNSQANHSMHREHSNVLNVLALTIDEPILELLVDTNVLKVKIFDLTGLTLYSTNEDDIGKQKSSKYGPITQAINGVIVTEAEERELFLPYNNKMLENAFIVSSYLPVYDDHNKNVVGVFEIYTDGTEARESVTNSLLKFSMILAGMFVMILIIGYYLLRSLDSVIHNNIDLVVARDGARKSDQAKSTFLANMSHELRTPLNAIIGYSELLEEEISPEPDAHTLEDVNKIKSAARHLLHVINEILDLSKIEAGQSSVYFEDIKLGLLIEEVVSVTKPLVNKNNNKLKLKLPDEVFIFRTDVIKLRQILFNLVSNATKFTENGQVTLSMTILEEEIKISVSDTGIGMSETQIDGLFKPFTQADASTTRKYGGTGLGLTITKEYCEMMGGSIAVYSLPDSGTTFTIKLPLKSGLNNSEPVLKTGTG